MLKDFFYNIDRVRGFVNKVIIILLILSATLLYTFGLSVIMDKLVISNRTAESFLIANTKLNTIVYSTIPIVVILMLVLYVAILILINREGSYIFRFGQINKIPQKRKFGLLKISFIYVIILSILSFCFYYTVKNYYELLPNKIVRHNLIKAKELTYSYGDIKYCDIKIKSRGKNNSELVYNINFNDGSSFDAAHNIYNEGSYIGAIGVLDNIILDKKIKKNIDKQNYYLLLNGKDEDEIKIYQRIFNE
ncbi:hypothetical protein [Clostridium folliculivorans]|uniref:Uncharacterized protein n=1 Tax=Clostridium folliculivorans TaxID=2886038 RepID=A0A9W5Y1D7_9CLOT|nr:hypothetical protein [Clostridium folliculivorans]GKU24835.1 hypothetical protein CFOLD11_16610 [Clostridium folliculivorans]GKU30933.1 hypothetical protein CFB3_30400 [Clostridium folliculivorans]